MELVGMMLSKYASHRIKKNTILFFLYNEPQQVQRQRKDNGSFQELGEEYKEFVSGYNFNFADNECSGDGWLIWVLNIPAQAFGNS